MTMRDDGEPTSRLRLDRRAVELTALRDSLVVAALFGGVALINGILAILLIDFFQALGWWVVLPPGSEGAADALSERLERRVVSTG
jgi:hypothetical protein